MKEIRYPVQVRFSETAGGVVHHAHYHTWFDLAQSELLHTIGHSVKEMLERGLRFMPIQVECRYLAPAYFEDPLVVILRIKDISGLKTVLEYEIINQETGRCIAVCEGTYTCMNHHFRPVQMKKAWPEVYEKLAELAER